MALSLKLRRITSALKSKHQSSWEDHNGRLVAALRFFSVGSSFNQPENHGTSMLLNHQKSGLIYVGLWALMIFDWILEGDGRLIGTSCGRKGQHLSRSTGRTSHCTSAERLPLTLEEGLHHGAGDWYKELSGEHFDIHGFLTVLQWISLDHLKYAFERWVAEHEFWSGGRRKSTMSWIWFHDSNLHQSQPKIDKPRAFPNFFATSQTNCWFWRSLKFWVSKPRDFSPRGSLNQHHTGWTHGHHIGPLFCMSRLCQRMCKGLMATPTCRSCGWRCFGMNLGMNLESKPSQTIPNWFGGFHKWGYPKMVGL